MSFKFAYSILLKAHLAQLKKEFSTSESILLTYVPNLDEKNIYLPATWLWNLQNHLKRDRENSRLKNIDIAPIVSFLERNWRQPYNSIWESEKSDIFISNIGMVYAALLETKNNNPELNYLQKTITEIRDFVFDSFLSGGMLLNAYHERTISADMLAAVLPYGLFSPEDLIVVEAVAHLEKLLVTTNGVKEIPEDIMVSSAATAWLSLYYLEKGNGERANFLLDLAMKQLKEESEGKSQLGLVLIDTINFYKGVSNNECRIIHFPLGNQNIYEPQLTERAPHYPTIDDTVKIDCQVWPEGEADSATLHVHSYHGQLVQIKNLEKKYNKDKNIFIWSGDIEPLSEQQNYTYEILAYKGEKLLAKSDAYPLIPLLKRNLNKFTLLKKTEHELALLGADQYNQLFVQLTVGFKEGHFYIDVDRNFKGGLVNGREQETNYKITSPNGELSLNVSLNPFSIELKNYKDIILKSHQFLPYIECLTDINLKIRELTLNFHTPLKERFYGFGERYNGIQQRGNIIDCYVYNQYRDQGTRTYLPVPFYISSLGYGLVVNTNMYTYFDVAHSLKDALSLKARLSKKEQKVSFTAFFGSPKKIITDFTTLTGKPALPPVWAFGPWMSSNNWDRDKVVRSEVEKTKKYEIPATVLVLEQWSDETTYYMFNDADYKVKHGGESHSYDEIVFPQWGRWPDPKGLFNYLHQNGLKVILWQIPIQKYLNRQTHPQKDLDEKYMIDNGFAVKCGDGSPYRMPEGWFKESLLMDFSNEEAKNWWFEKRKYLMEIGVDGFKTDGGEFVFGEGLIFADGKTGDEMRNLYPNDYVESYYEFAQQYKPGDSMTFSRAGYMGAQNFPAHWAGDERSTFDAFKRSLAAGITAGLSGIPFWSWDLAGFNGDIPTAELYVRSAAMAAFCPIMQYHAESKGEFNQDRTPWNIAERTKQEIAIDGYRFYANVRMNLFPYLWNEARKTNLTGIPMMRALFLEYPEDTRVEGMFDEYIFGSSFLVAPVTDEGATSRMVYFPKGTWYDLWKGDAISGPAFVTVQSPLGHIPVYVKGGSVILLNLDETNEIGSWVSNDIDRYVKPVLRIYLAGGTRETIIDHLNYKWNISVTEEAERWEISIDGPSFPYEVVIPEHTNPTRKNVFINGNKQA